MENIVQVRNIKLGEGLPKIAVPFMGSNNEEILKEVEYLKTIKVDIAEWRIDYYKEVENLEKVKEILSMVRKALGEIPLLVTFRTAKEGGEREISIEYYVELKKAIAETKNADLIDVELFIAEDEKVKDIVETAHKFGSKVIMSNHDFHKTPERAEIVKRLCKMQELGADIPKIAVMPVDAKDVLELLSATYEMKSEHGATPIITMSMGSLGVVSRLAGETFGSALTFGSAKTASAPGQLEANNLYEILKSISTNK